MSENTNSVPEEFIGKHYETVEEFFNSSDFKIFEKNCSAKLVEIAKKLKLYPNPDLADFAGSLTLSGPDRWGKRGLEFKSVDLGDKLNIKLFPSLWLTSFGYVRPCNQEIKNKNPDAPKKLVQLLSFDCNWRYNHYGNSGSNGADAFWCSFDLNGKLATFQAQAMPKKLDDLREKATNWDIFDKGAKARAEALLPEYKKAQKAFDAKCKKLIDRDNMLLAAGHSKKSVERE